MRAACVLIAVLACGATVADDTARRAVSQTATGCVEVEINGERTPAFDCLTQKLQPAPERRPPQPETPQAGEIVRRPGNQLGLFNQAATGHRMGNTFGTSVRPQRPDTPPPASPLIPPR